MSVRVLLVDDHPVVRSGLTAMLSSTGEVDVVGEAGDGPEALRLATSTRPEVVLLDIRMHGTNGLDLLRPLHVAAPDARVVILTTYDHDEYVQAAFERGAYAYLLKTASKEQMVATIAAVRRGERSVDPSLVPRILDRLGAGGGTTEEPWSPDEIELLQRLAEGATNRQIAARYHWSEMTIKRRLGQLFRKLGAADRTGAVAQAIKRGLI